LSAGCDLDTTPLHQLYEAEVAMSASIDQDPNTVSFYAPPRRRAVRLVQVSEAATALAAERTDLGGENGTSRGLLPDLSVGDMAIQRQHARPVRSLDPGLVPAPPSRRRSRSWLGVSLVAGILAFALIAFIAIDRFLPVPAASLQQARDGTVDLTSSSARLAAGSTRGIETEFPPLPLRGSGEMSAERAPFGVTLEGRAEGAMVLPTGLAAGMTLSTRSDLGAGAWQVPATDAVLSNAWIIPPKKFIGVDLLAELQLADRTIARRWPIPANWAAATPAIAVPTPAVEGQWLAGTPPRQSMPPQRQSDSDEIAILVKRGKGFIGNGDPVGARVMLRRAAESKNAEAALMLAATYDPVVLRELKVYGVAADIAMARTWYEKAKEFGSEEAPRFLEILATATH
jgi:hypothetical protein